MTLLAQRKSVDTPSAPMANPAVSPPRVAAKEPRARILFVDDDRLLRGLGEQVLAHSGYDVDTAGDGAEAWAMLLRRPYGLLITDNQMPRLTGLDLIRKARVARLTVPAILTSGAMGHLPDDDLQCLEGGVALPKPFTPEQLLSVVGDVLKSAGRPKKFHGAPLPVTPQVLHASPTYRCWGINE